MEFTFVSFIEAKFWKKIGALGVLGPKIFLSKISTTTQQTCKFWQVTALSDIHAEIADLGPKRSGFEVEISGFRRTDLGSLGLVDGR
jgi:hypothetical protein